MPASAPIADSKIELLHIAIELFELAKAVEFDRHQREQCLKV